MTHQHNHVHIESTAGQSLQTAFFLTLDTILEIIVSLWTDSVAILSDSAHYLGDSLSLFLQAVPEDIELEQFEVRLGALPQVLSTHYNDVWPSMVNTCSPHKSPFLTI